MIFTLGWLKGGEFSNHTPTCHQVWNVWIFFKNWGSRKHICMCGTLDSFPKFKREFRIQNPLCNKWFGMNCLLHLMKSYFHGWPCFDTLFFNPFSKHVCFGYFFWKPYFFPAECLECWTLPWTKGWEWGKIQGTKILLWFLFFIFDHPRTFHRVIFIFEQRCLLLCWIHPIGCWFPTFKLNCGGCYRVEGKYSISK